MGAGISNKRRERAHASVDSADARAHIQQPIPVPIAERGGRSSFAAGKQPRFDGGWSGWARRLGLAGFAFFFIKGMVWLGIGAVLWFLRFGPAG